MIDYGEIREYLDMASTFASDARVWFHEHPEMGFDLPRTTGFIKEQLKWLGIDYKDGVGKSGITADIIGSSGPCVALRADMDALPEIGHACGHDAHTGMLLGAAYTLLQLSDRGKLPGTVRLLFQPNEEGVGGPEGGALPMIEDGAMRGVDAVFGLHCDPTKDVGLVGVNDGVMLPGRAVHTYSGLTDTDRACLLKSFRDNYKGDSIRMLERGEELLVSITFFDNESLIGMNEYLDKYFWDHVFERKMYVPYILNHTDAYVAMKRGILAFYGYDALVPAGREDMLKMTGPPLPPGQTPLYPFDDYAWFAQYAPSCFGFLGVRTPGEETKPLHTVDFDIDPAAYKVGISTLVGAALNWRETV